MFSAKTTIGHNHQKRFGRNAKRWMAYKAPREKLLQQEKLPEVAVKYNPYDYDNEELFSLVGYLCPHCRQKLWLEYFDGRRNIICPICRKEFILNIKRECK